VTQGAAAALAFAGLVGGLLGLALDPLALWLPSHSWPAVRPVRWRRVALPLAGALAGAILWQHYGAGESLMLAAVVALFLLLITAIDIDRRLVLNEVLAVGGALALVRAALGGWSMLSGALLGGLVGLSVFLLLAMVQRGALGMGDVKLAGALGLALGYPAILTALFWGVMVGGVCAAILLLSRRVGRHGTIPYAPFLAAGGILALLWVL
jgi:leader peptidase (prepilin peptidase) / N-methyltransferase